jgi:hypothetical protein
MRNMRAVLLLWKLTWFAPIGGTRDQRKMISQRNSPL